MITDGYIKSTIHAVQRPPADQDKYDRLALLYFLRLADDVPVVGAPSPLLQRIGWKKEEENDAMEAPIRGEGKSLRARIGFSRLSLIVKKTPPYRLDESASQGLQPQDHH